MLKLIKFTVWKTEKNNLKCPWRKGRRKSKCTGISSRARNRLRSRNAIKWPLNCNVVLKESKIYALNTKA